MVLISDGTSTAIGDDTEMEIETDGATIQQKALARDISRKQSAILDFSTSRDYAVGDLALYEQIQRRCISAVTAGAFDPVEWTAADSIGVKDVVVVYSQNDFPAVVNDVIPLANHTAYLLGATITITDKFFIDSLFVTKIFSIGSPAGLACDPNLSGPLFVSPDTGTNIDSVASGTNDVPVFTTSEAHGLTTGDVVNIRTLTAYNEVGQFVTVLSTTTFSVTAMDFVTDDTGAWDQGVGGFTLSDITIRGLNSITLFDVVASRAGNSTVTIDGCNIMNFHTFGRIEGGNYVQIHDLFLTGVINRLILRDCITLIVNRIYSVSEMTGTCIGFRGLLTNFVNITDVVIPMGADDYLFGFPTTTVGNPVNPLLESHIHDCKDLTGDNDVMFDPENDGLDSTSINFSVHDNGKQRDSVTLASLKRIGSSYTFSPSSADLMVPVSTDSWEIDAGMERFTFTTDPVTGEFTYDGPNPICLLIHYTAAMRAGAAGTTLTTGLLINGDQYVSANLPVTVAGTQIVYTMSQSVIVEVNPGDTIHFGVKTVPGTPQVTSNVITMSAVKIA